MELDCGVMVTCGHRDVDLDVFKSIHNNGLVYNGRLIVDKNFGTTDRSIFSAGSLCEFSNKFLG
jgi:thioredoxin reductase